jgi:hypothetical protein
MFSVSAFAPPKAPAARPKADPSPNLFVSGAAPPFSCFLFFPGETYAAASSVRLAPVLNLWRRWTVTRP